MARTTWILAGAVLGLTLGGAQQVTHAATPPSIYVKTASAGDTVPRVTATCNSGDVATGGGYDTTAGDPGAGGIAVTESKPVYAGASQTPYGWEAGSPKFGPKTAYVVCVHAGAPVPGVP
jgi:hypothetical protein